MNVTFAPGGILQIDEARLIYRNFSGEASKYNREGDRNFAIIIPDQDIALCCELHWNIAEKLNTLNDPNLTFVSFSNGDGDEGCVYFNYLPYNIVFERYPGLKTALNEAK